LNGAVRDPGPGCALADTGFSIDGNAYKWADSRVADFGDVLVTRNGTKSLLFFFPTVGPPPTDGLTRWMVLMRNADMLAADTNNSIVKVEVGMSEPAVTYNGISLTGLPIKWALTPSGVELSVPIDLVPFDGQTILEDYTLAYTNGQYSPVFDFPFGNDVCWDPSNIENHCLSPL
jgi:hypothetical protein